MPSTDAATIRFIRYKTKKEFLANTGNAELVRPGDYILIEDQRQIYNRGVYYGASATDISTIQKNIEDLQKSKFKLESTESENSPITISIKNLKDPNFDKHTIFADIALSDDPNNLLKVATKNVKTIVNGEQQTVTKPVLTANLKWIERD